MMGSSGEWIGKGTGEGIWGETAKIKGHPRDSMEPQYTRSFPTYIHILNQSNGKFQIMEEPESQLDTSCHQMKLLLLG